MPLKPGWQTSEFYVTVVLGGLSVLTALGVVGPSGGAFVRGHVEQWATLASGLIAAAYSISRAIVKHQYADAGRIISGEITQFTDPASPILGTGKSAGNG